MSKQLFQILPQVLENYVFQFNADHRELMQPVLLSIVSRHTCMYCCEPTNKQKYPDIGFDFCSVSCYNLVDGERSNMYYHPYIEVLLNGPDHYDEDYMTHMRYY